MQFRWLEMGPLTLLFLPETQSPLSIYVHFHPHEAIPTKERSVGGCIDNYPTSHLPELHNPVEHRYCLEFAISLIPIAVVIEMESSFNTASSHIKMALKQQ